MWRTEIGRRARWVLAGLLGAGVVVLGAQLLPGTLAAEDAGVAGGGEPAKVEPLEGTGHSRVRLSHKAAERLDIRTAPVREAPGGAGQGRRKVVPYGAVLYDARGRTWVYTSPEPLVFIRAAIEVDRIRGGRAVLSTGPPAGTRVVTVGVAELYGTEFEVEEH